jgi:uncharacterized protein YprB with RNaseH-like and TPR domain
MKFEDKLKGFERFISNRQVEKRKDSSDVSLTEYLEGVEVENIYGKCIKVEKEFSLDFCHGQILISDGLRYKGETLAKFTCDEKLSALEPERMVFLDTETTGLAGGTGTYAFLVGIGFFEEDKFRIKQYFMRDFNEEKALLYVLQNDLKQFDSLVTYNGKCFDAPLLNTRFVFNRIDFSFDNFIHLDLLFPSRRLWKIRLKDCSLSNVESNVLRVTRENDIPSYVIPQAYFNYLNSGEIEPLKKILDHNTDDILSLVGLSIFSSQIIEDPIKAGINEPLDLFSLGKIYTNLREYQKSILCLEKAWWNPPDEKFKLKIGEFLAWQYKRSGKWEKAEKIWEALSSNSGGDEFRPYFRKEPLVFYPYEELAKYYEHKSKDYALALKMVDKALKLIASSFGLGDDKRLREIERRFCHRRERLKRKLLKNV